MQWFKHDSDAHTDAKLQSILMDYGLEGYGLYFYCIELIVKDVSKHNLTFEIEHDARLIARATGSSEQKVTEMMTQFVKLGLFEQEAGGRITCLKILKRLDQSQTSDKGFRELIESAKKSNSHDSVMTNHDAVMTSHDKSGLVMQEEKRREESRREESRGEEKKKRKEKRLPAPKKRCRRSPKMFGQHTKRLTKNDTVQSH